LPAESQLNGIQRKNLFLITKEAFHNVLKHAEASTVTLNISMQERLLHIDIADNGKGIHSENLFGNGLKNMRRRIDEINGSFTISNGIGTNISLTLPLT